MKRSIVILIMITSLTPLQAMELVELISSSKRSLSNNDYRLIEDTLDIIQEQKIALSNPVIIDSARGHLNVVHSSLKLDALCGAFRALPETSKRDAMKIMSIQLLHLHALALCFPPEIVNYIVLCMLDGEKGAVEKFYALPFTQAFDLFHQIKIGLTDDTKPVGPLYVKSQHVRDLVLKVQKKPWYYSLPIVDFENKEEIDVLPEDIKNIYLHDKEILVLPDEEHNACTQKKLCLGACVAGGIGLTTFGSLSAVLAVVGKCSGWGATWACNGPILHINLGASFGLVSSYSCLVYSCQACKSLCRHSQEVTI